jgi:hypothetical protein
MPITRRLNIAILAAAVVAASGISALRFARPAKARAQDGCSASTVQGTFGYAFEGVAGGAPVAGIGHVTNDGSGNASGADSLSINGVPVQRTYTGTYTVKSDCTGTATFLDSLGNTFHESGVVMNGGNQIATIVTDPGAVIAFVDVRQ